MSEEIVEVVETERSEVLEKVKALLGEETSNAFEREEITTFEVLTNLVSREADSPIFTRLGLSYGKAVKLQEEFAYLRRADGNSLRNNKLTIATSPKPTMTALSNVDAATRQLYLARRKKIGVEVVKAWGDDLPKFNTPEAKAKLEKLAKELEKDCGVEELNFGAEGIALHIKSFCNEQRRYQKSKRRHSSSSQSGTDENEGAEKAAKIGKVSKRETDEEGEDTDDTISVYEESQNNSIDREDDEDSVGSIIPPSQENNTPSTNTNISFELSTCQKIVKLVYGKVLNRDEMCGTLKKRFDVAAKNMVKLKPSELMIVLAKKLVKFNYCNVASEKGKLDVVVLKEIEL